MIGDCICSAIYCSPKFMCVESVQEELDNMAKTYPDRFKIYYVLNQVNPMLLLFYKICVSTSVL